jgi:hypothetical protein
MLCLAGSMLSLDLCNVRKSNLLLYITNSGDPIMELKFLLPNKYKKIGLIIFAPSFVLGILFMLGIGIKINFPVFAFWAKAEHQLGSAFFFLKENDIYNELLAFVLIISLGLIAFSKERFEDEYIGKIRLESLLWAVIINYILLLLALVLVYDLEFYSILTYNMFTILILFVIRFNFVLYLNRKQMDNEK